MKSFGTFRLDTVNLCVWEGENRLSLTPKGFDVLRYLVEHANRLVSQDEILDALWPETYVNPEVVKKYVLEIRKALRDPSDKPAYVATFRRRGYHFIAPVRDEIAWTHSIVACNGFREIVGRESALAQVSDAVAKSLRGQRQILFVTGEAGVGKTTLIDTFLQILQTAGCPARIARGHCVEGFGGKEPYYPVLEAVGELLRDTSDEAVAQQLARTAPTWLAQFPALVSTETRDSLEEEIVDATRERMVREICEGLEAISLERPLILWLEDLHWVDASTLDFISAMARRRSPAKLLLVATYRSADAPVAQSHLKALKQDLLVHDLCQEIALERLAEPDVARYLAIHFENAEFPSGFAEAIHRHSGGNALFMVTILQDMVKKGTIVRRGQTWTLTVPVEAVALCVPDTLDELVEVQFRQLSETEQGVLRSASVAGDHFSVWAIAGASGAEPTEIDEACERLAERKQFIQFTGIQELANGQISAHYDFLHSFYREALYRRLSQVSRSRMHLLIGERLKGLCEPCEQEFATELALHFERGYDYAQAIRYLIQAAENATGRFAYGSAIENLNHALKLASRVSEPQRTGYETRILEIIGDAQLALGALPESTEAYLAAAKRTAEAGLKISQSRAIDFSTQLLAVRADF